ncbi:MAG TPA: DUF2066 domain-containing protein [Steroidobacteraceae bacterium]|nr:DUF2066 domain-containing protein [Steroidobacteraceae bacterium]
MDTPTELSGPTGRRRFRALTGLAGALALATLAHPVAAARPVQVYEVTVADGASMLQEAMGEALVRTTGRRDAASDPVYAPLLHDAQRYVRSQRALSDGRTQVIFDGDAIERQIDAAGRSVWGNERPFTLVVLSPPLSGTAADTARRTLEQIAETRGLPVSLVPMALTDASGHDLSSDALLASAQSLGADDLLIGRGDTAAAASGGGESFNPNGTWQWTLVSGFAKESWTGNLEAGVNGAVDALARVQDGKATASDAEALVQVSGVTSLADYAALERLFSGLPGVRRSGLEEADGATVTFRLLIRGGSDALTSALAGAAHLSSSGVDSSRLLYQYHP